MGFNHPKGLHTPIQGLAARTYTHPLQGRHIGRWIIRYATVLSPGNDGLRNYPIKETDNIVTRLAIYVVDDEIWLWQATKRVQFD